MIFQYTSLVTRKGHAQNKGRHDNYYIIILLPNHIKYKKFQQDNIMENKGNALPEAQINHPY